MSERAYALREDAEEAFSDAAVTVAGGKTLKIGDRLEEGGGVIVTDDPREQHVLDRCAVLKTVSLAEAEATRVESSDLTNDQLRALLDEKGVDHTGAKVKAELLALLDEANTTAGESGEEDH